MTYEACECRGKEFVYELGIGETILQILCLKCGGRKTFSMKNGIETPPSPYTDRDEWKKYQQEMKAQ